MRYPRPEWVILSTARLQRAKDERDLRAVPPVLDAGRRAWLREAIAEQHPGHDGLAVI